MVKITSRYSLLFIFLLIGSLFYNSCIIFPVYIPPSGRGLIDTSNIKPGVTTKEEVFLELGCRFQKISDDERLFTLGYVKQGDFSWVWIAGGYYFAFGGSFGDRKINDMYELEIEFDENDVVKRCETFEYPHKDTVQNAD